MYNKFANPPPNAFIFTSGRWRYVLLGENMLRVNYWEAYRATNPQEIEAERGYVVNGNVYWIPDTTERARCAATP